MIHYLLDSISIEDFTQRLMFSYLTWPVCLGILFFEALILSLILTPFARQLGLKKFLDQPGERKIHKVPIPRSGGIAIFGSFIIVIFCNGLAAWIFRDTIATHIPEAKNVFSKGGELLAVIIGAIWIFFVGLWDDKVTMSPRAKLICQLIAVIPILVAGIQLKSFLPIYLGKLLTVFWIVLLMNSLNFLDNMDGLSSGVGTICSLIFAWIAYDSGQYYMTGMFLVLAGSLIGFLRYNFNPASIFMGDGGSMFLGYMLGSLSILTTYWNSSIDSGLPVLMPIIVLGVPLFDTLSVFYIRWYNGKPLYVGDTNHFSHRMVALGMSQKKAVIFIYFVTACVGLSALPFKSLNFNQALIYSLQVIFWFVIIFMIERLGQNRNSNS